MNVLLPLFHVGSRGEAVTAQEEADHEQNDQDDTKEDRKLEAIPETLLDGGVIILFFFFKKLRTRDKMETKNAKNEPRSSQSRRSRRGRQ